MSIRKRLLLSNIGMIVVPIICFFLLEILLGYLMFIVFNGDPKGEDMKLFLSLRFFGLVIVLVITNGLLTYFVSKSILSPIRELTEAAKKISDGDLDFQLEAKKADELGHLAATFDSMRASLKEAREEQFRYEKNRQELIASISHDLKTPLTSIKGYVKGVQDGVANTPDKLERYMETIYAKADDIDHMIEELFTYSKLDLEKETFHFEQIDIRAFLDDMVGELAFTLEKDGGSACFAAEGEDPLLVKADRAMLKRALNNITQNSLKYMNENKKQIKVGIQEGAEFVTVSIHDNGEGIAAKDLPFIFESFFRTDDSRNSATGGSGLGLAIVKKIIEAHSGTVWASSEPGKGTSIHFTLKRVS
ncbi:sensor histidine kinase [Thalassobacillus pellis]|uniref:sensor histidine kinase n=1 Tax=Thalassobacillus pellis TaxID=748008 RepID=UPI001961DE54|nr:HAMP domain-containing sensor histidine kinase [Thalassobacillus pellis]MBM7554229.1 histidine kinase [Thalassobacillus pellis]